MLCSYRPKDGTIVHFQSNDHILKKGGQLTEVCVRIETMHLLILQWLDRSGWVVCQARMAKVVDLLLVEELHIKGLEDFTQRDRQLFV